MIAPPRSSPRPYTWLAPLLACLFACGQAAAAPVEQAIAELGSGFSSGRAEVNGVTLYYVRGGNGPALCLLHGFPEDWSAYRSVMPRLAERFSVVATDLRGIGRSSAADGGYDAASMAEDVHQLLQHLGMERSYVVGHDIGGMVAYALARRHPEATRGLMLLESPVPGLDPWDELEVNPGLWHFGFHQVPGLAERVLLGRQSIYFRDGFLRAGAVDPEVFTDEIVARYVRAHARPAQLRAAMEMYRAFPQNEAANAADRTPTDLPLTAAAAAASFGPILGTLAKDLRAHGWSNVQVEQIENSGHYVVDEQPEAVAELIERYASP